jgi:hypothetical protein
VVQDVESALQALAGTVRALSKDKCTQKANYFRAEAEKNFLPDSNTRIIKSEQAASLHVSNAIRLWSQRMEIPVADANIIMNVLGSLEKIMSADERILQDIPIDVATKSKLLQFFSNKDMTMKINNNGAQHFEHQNHDYEFIPNVGDSKDCNRSIQFAASNHDTQFFAPNDNVDVQTQVHQSPYEQHHQPRRAQESRISYSQGISRIFQQRAVANNFHLHGSEFGYHNDHIMSKPMNQFSQSRALMRMHHPVNHNYVNTSNHTPLHTTNHNYHRHQQQFSVGVDNNSNQLSHLEWSNNVNSNNNGYFSVKNSW